MDLKNIESFIQVASLGSFTKAAKELGYSQSTISFQIKQLEETIGVPLFERINHTIKLTPKGSEILSIAYQMQALTKEIQKIADETKEMKGNIRIAMADSLCHWLLWDNFEAFHNKYPKISLKIISASTEEMFRLVRQNEVDLVYTLDKHIYNPNYMIAYEKKVYAHFVVSVSHPLALKESIKIDEVLNTPSILTEKGMSYRRILEEFLASKSLSIQPFLEIGDTSLICRLVEQNMGISFLPDYVTEPSVRDGNIKRLKIDDFSIDIWLQLLYHYDKWCSPEMQCVLDYLTNTSLLF